MSNPELIVIRHPDTVLPYLPSLFVPVHRGGFGDNLNVTNEFWRDRRVRLEYSPRGNVQQQEPAGSERGGGSLERAIQRLMVSDVRDDCKDTEREIERRRRRNEGFHIAVDRPDREIRRTRLRLQNRQHLLAWFCRDNLIPGLGERDCEPTSPGPEVDDSCRRTHQH